MNAISSRRVDLCFTLANCTYMYSFTSSVLFNHRIDPDFVDGLRNFNISCSLVGNALNCISDSVTLPGRTMCQVDSGPVFQCKSNVRVQSQCESTVNVRAM